MKPEAQRIAIAEACGFQKKEAPKHVFYWYKPNTFPNGAHGISDLPDYLNDLNAMHEAEETLSTWSRKDNFCTSLCKKTGGYGWSNTHATASQRAEAFLRTIGKWVES